MGFSDIFKNRFLSQVNNISPASALVTMAVAIVLGLVIFIVYKKTFKGVMYSSSFNMSLLLMTVITSVIIMTISSNVVLSLGMVGALSIIRFRTVIKDPIDIMYLFWAISIGIIVGAGQYIFAAICVVVIGVLCFVMSIMKSKERMYLLVIRYDMSAIKVIDKAIKSINGKVRNKTVTKSKIETIVEVDSKVVEGNFVERLGSTNGVISAVLVNYNGEYSE